MSQDKSFKTAPVPLATAERGSSATVTGSPVFSLRRRSIPRSSEPPPAITKPRSTRSADNSVAAGEEGTRGPGGGKPRLFVEGAVDPAEQRAAAGHHEPPVAQVRGQFG